MSEHDSLIERLRQHALPDPHDEREVMHAPLLREAAAALSSLAAEVERLRAVVKTVDEKWLPNHDEMCKRMDEAIERAESAEARVLEVERVLGELVAACDTLNEVNGRQMVDRHSQEAARALLKERDDG